MKLWLQGALLFVWGGAVTALSAWAYRFPRLRGLCAGGVTSFVLCLLFPLALQQCAAVVVILSFSLGITLSAFLHQSLSAKLYYEVCWGILLFFCAFFRMRGQSIPCALLYLAATGISLSKGRFTLAPIMIPLGWFWGGIWPLSSQWQGIFLGVCGGLLLYTVQPHRKNDFVGGMTIGLILSFL